MNTYDENGPGFKSGDNEIGCCEDFSSTGVQSEEIGTRSKAIQSVFDPPLKNQTHL